MSDIGSVHALLRAEEVDDTVTDLWRHGIHGDEIRVEPAPAGRWLIRDETLHRDALGARHGARLGLLAGLLAGAVVAAVAAATGTESGTAWVIAMLGFGGFGALIGAMIGLQVSDTNDDDPVRFHDLTEDSGLWALSVDSPRWAFTAHRILERHAAEFVEFETPAVNL